MSGPGTAVDGDDTRVPETPANNAGSPPVDLTPLSSSDPVLAGHISKGREAKQQLRYKDFGFIDDVIAKVEKYLAPPDPPPPRLGDNWTLTLGGIYGLLDGCGLSFSLLKFICTCFALVTLAKISVAIPTLFATFPVVLPITLVTAGVIVLCSIVANVCKSPQSSEQSGNSELEQPVLQIIHPIAVMLTRLKSLWKWLSEQIAKYFSSFRDGVKGPKNALRGIENLALLVPVLGGGIPGLVLGTFMIGLAIWQRQENRKNEGALKTCRRELITTHDTMACLHQRLVLMRYLESTKGDIERSDQSISAFSLGAHSKNIEEKVLRTDKERVLKLGKVIKELNQRYNTTRDELKAVCLKNENKEALPKDNTLTWPEEYFRIHTGNIGEFTGKFYARLGVALADGVANAPYLALGILSIVTISGQIALVSTIFLPVVLVACIAGKLGAECLVQSEIQIKVLETHCRTLHYNLIRLQMRQAGLCGQNQTNDYSEEIEAHRTQLISSSKQLCALHRPNYRDAIFNGLTSGSYFFPVVSSACFLLSILLPLVAGIAFPPMLIPITAVLGTTVVIASTTYNCVKSSYQIKTFANTEETFIHKIKESIRGGAFDIKKIEDYQPIAFDVFKGEDTPDWPMWFEVFRNIFYSGCQISKVGEFADQLFNASPPGESGVALGFFLVGLLIHTFVRSLRAYRKGSDDSALSKPLRIKTPIAIPVTPVPALPIYTDDQTDDGDPTLGELLKADQHLEKPVAGAAPIEKTCEGGKPGLGGLAASAGLFGNADGTTTPPESPTTIASPLSVFTDSTDSDIASDSGLTSDDEDVVTEPNGTTAPLGSPNTVIDDHHAFTVSGGATRFFGDRDRKQHTHPANGVLKWPRVPTLQTAEAEPLTLATANLQPQ